MVEVIGFELHHGIIHYKHFLLSKKIVCVWIDQIIALIFMNLVDSIGQSE